MTKKKVWLYKCDFCRRSMRSSGHMKRHETSCTKNPARTCRMHHNFDKAQPLMNTLLSCLGCANDNPEEAMKLLREASHGCPMCMLAAIRISGVEKWDGDPDNQPPNLNFDFKQELASAWETINDASAQYESEMRSAYYGVAVKTIKDWLYGVQER